MCKNNEQKVFTHTCTLHIGANTQSGFVFQKTHRNINLTGLQSVLEHWRTTNCKDYKYNITPVQTIVKNVHE